ncbi:MAG: NAD-glutamate dehydrogenase [Verrucomicrobia bacterium]|nr:NAD-glutamate dehydrogenase [Verrucomicrobiota bacterium]
MTPGEKKARLQEAARKESHKFEQYYVWIEEHLPASFFEDADPDTLVFVTHSLMSFEREEFFSHIHFKDRAITLTLDGPDSDLKILRHYRHRGIQNYRSFVSNAPPPFEGLKVPLRIAVIYFAGGEDKGAVPRFERSLNDERKKLAHDVWKRSEDSDACQLELVRNREAPTLQIVLAWKNAPQHEFLYRISKVVRRHGLAMLRLAAVYTPENTLLLSMGLDGKADVDDFLQELMTVKYFLGHEVIEKAFVDTGFISGNQGNLLKAIVSFVHQVLVHADPHMYALPAIEEGLSRHPELTIQVIHAFEAKFHPKKHDLKNYEKIKAAFLASVAELDTGNIGNDIRRKNILIQALSFAEHTLKTNFYCKEKTALSFRLDPHYLENVPYERREKFPEIPFAVFFMKGMYFIGFHIRFRDLARGGLRTVYPAQIEQMLIERNNVFSECYNLAYTQQKKNKDIPEGGAKGVIFLEAFESILKEEEMMQRELETTGLEMSRIEEKIAQKRQEHRLNYLYSAQRCYIESFITVLQASNLIDYYKKPEYVYLGPDENMHDSMITWISSYAKAQGYKPGSAFMSSKPGAGINHKEYGVTSRGINVYMEEVLQFLDIDPHKEPFTIKMSGGPDGDVAGNQMHNLYRFFPKTAKFLATIDVSGTIFDPEGLDLKIISELFEQGKPIRFYPAEKLSDGGFLLDTKTRREETAYAQQTLLLRKKGKKVIEEWIPGSEMNHILRTNVHQTKADIFIPGGGRPRTLNESNYKDFLDSDGKPTARAIIEGANLYLTQEARRALEKLGTIIIKDSSANKGGVICSSFEVLSGLVLSDEEFIQEKPRLVEEILTIIMDRSKDEASLLLRTSDQGFLTDISEKISEQINHYKDEILTYLTPLTLSNDPQDLYLQCLIKYAPPLLQKKYSQRLIKEIPDIHKKAVIACFLAQRLVYRRGFEWAPSVVDILPLIVKDPHVTED